MEAESRRLGEIWPARCGRGQQRTHQATKPLERPRDPDRRVHFDQDALGGVDIDLKASCLVERRVEQSQEALQMTSVPNGQLPVLAA